MTTAQTPVAPRNGPLDYESFLVGVGQLTANYPPRATSEDGADALFAAWWRVLGALSDRDRLTDAVFDRAVQETLSSKREYLPTIGEFLSICDYAAALLERERRPGLPPPAPHASAWRELPEDERRARWNREVARGKAQIRKRLALIAADRAEHTLHSGHPVPPEVWRDLDEPTEAEIAAVERELAARDSWRVSDQIGALPAAG